MTVQIKTNETRAILDSPYHPDLPSKAKAIGGRFDGQTRNWLFDIRDLDRVRQLALDVYGTDGSPQDLVTVRMTISSGGVWPVENPLWACGRKVAERRFRDSDVTLGDGVIVVNGKFHSAGGSRKYPNLAPDGEVTLEIRDVPRSLAEKEDDVEIVDEAADKLVTLQARRQSLLEELAQIDAEIAELA
jgi:hypothetical protein